MSKVIDNSIFGMMFLLIVFWLLILEELSLWKIFVGVISSVIIVLFTKDFVLDRNLRFVLNIANICRVIKYILALIKEIVIANIQVAQIVLSRKMKISPAIVRFKGKLTKETSKAILGNSITLTPGTLTVEIDGDDFIIHGLTRKHAENPMDWYLVDWLLEMEKEDEGK